MGYYIKIDRLPPPHFFWLWESVPVAPSLLKVSMCNYKMMKARISPSLPPVEKRNSSLHNVSPLFSKSLCTCWRFWGFCIVVLDSTFLHVSYMAMV